ncbi:unnamed protein product [Hymenolepis diminuta]|uniref:DDE_Tnp_1_7 domain-containing protein n=1 Tax=Hymenolepis diminuta TaxID=6216 RepID=A0A0R3SEQ7_HYMDI|nr:unnamed protein product [Hymenolepis diminuta]
MRLSSPYYLFIDSGQSVTHTGPVSESYALSHATERSPFVGHGHNDYLGKMFCKQGFCFFSVSRTEGIKEKLCYVTLNYDSDKQKATKKSYQLSYGNVNEIGSE